MSDLPTCVVFDLDGTLAESKQPITEHMGSLLATLLEEKTVAVMSGGSIAQFHTQLLPHIPEATLKKLYLFPDNAAQCFTYNTDWQAAYDKSFSSSEKMEILQAISEALAESGIDTPERLWGERIEDRGAQITFSGLGQTAPLDQKKLWDPDHKKRALLCQILERTLPAYSVAYGGMTSVDITRKGINKAYGLTELARMSHIPITDMLYVGDALGPGGNDAVVIDTGVHTHQVASPEDTEVLIRSLLTGGI